MLLVVLQNIYTGAAHRVPRSQTFQTHPPCVALGPRLRASPLDLQLPPYIGCPITVRYEYSAVPILLRVQYCSDFISDFVLYEYCNASSQITVQYEYGTVQYSSTVPILFATKDYSYRTRTVLVL